MDGLVEAGGGGAQRGGGQQTDGAGDLRCLVRENVAEHVLRHYHIELTGVADDLHGAVIHQHVLVFHIGEFLSETVHHLTPEAGGGEDVCLIHGSDLIPAETGQFKGLAADALDLQFGVGHEVGGLDAPILRLVAIPLTEVDAAGQLPNHHDVKALLRRLLFQGRCVCHTLAHGGGAQVGEKAQIFADGEECCLRPLLSGLVAAPFRAADRTEEDGVALLASLCCTGGVTHAHCVGGAAAHQDVHEGELVSELVPHRLHDLDRLVHDLRADAVAPDQGNFIFAHRVHLCLSQFNVSILYSLVRNCKYWLGFCSFV